jgi:hypothetical protein
VCIETTFVAADYVDDDDSLNALDVLTGEPKLLMQIAITNAIFSRCRDLYQVKGVTMPFRGLSCHFRCAVDQGQYLYVF